MIDYLEAKGGQPVSPPVGVAEERHAVPGPLHEPLPLDLREGGGEYQEHLRHRPCERIFGVLGVVVVQLDPVVFLGVGTGSRANRRAMPA
jgi:hypothetical protein